MSEAEAYYKILPHLKLKYSNVATIFIPTDKKELRSKFLMKLDKADANYAKGSEVKGGKEGIFLEKPDIVDKFCRREITEKNPELEKLTLIHFSKMYDPIRSKKSKDEEDKQPTKPTENIEPEKNESTELWDDDEERVANYYITGDEQYDNIPLPKIIKLKNCAVGEVTLMEKRSFPKAARMHKKREDNNPHKFFLSELMLYTGYTDEKQLGCDDEEQCRELYLQKKEAIQIVKSYLMPFSEGVDEARHYVQEAMKEENQPSVNFGNLLDAEMEQEILECQELDENEKHPDFVELNPEDFEFESNVTQIRRTLRKIEINTADEILKKN